MEREGYVSLWLGNIMSEKILDEYVEAIYTEDGLVEESQFLRDFNIDIDEFDEDFIESIYKEKNIEILEEILKGCSYEENVIPRFNKLVKKKQVKEYNAAILLYNFKYKGHTKKINNSSYDFRYVGTVKYE